MVGGDTKAPITAEQPLKRPIEHLPELEPKPKQQKSLDLDLEEEEVVEEEVVEEEVEEEVYDIEDGEDIDQYLTDNPFEGYQAPDGEQSGDSAIVSKSNR